MKRILLTLCICAACIAAEAPRQFFANSGEWQGDFVYNTDNTRTIPLKSSFTAEFTDEVLILKVDFRDTDAARLKKFPKGKDGEWPNCDKIEIFFSPKKDHTFIQLGIGVNGQLFDTRWLNFQKTSWTAEVKIDDGGWTAVVTLPFSDPGFSVPQKGDTWGFNICRDVFPETSSMYYSSWAHCGISFRQPDTFGHLVFGTVEEAKAAWKQKREEDLAAIEAKIEAAGLMDQFAMQLHKVREGDSDQALKDLKDEIDMLAALKLMK